MLRVLSLREKTGADWRIRVTMRDFMVRPGLWVESVDTYVTVPVDMQPVGIFGALYVSCPDGVGINPELLVKRIGVPVPDPKPGYCRLISAWPTRNYADDPADWSSGPIEFVQDGPRIKFGYDASIEPDWTPPTLDQGWAAGQKAISNWIPTGLAATGTFRLEVRATDTVSNFVQANIAADASGRFQQRVKGAVIGTSNREIIDEKEVNLLSGSIYVVTNNGRRANGSTIPANIALLCTGYRLLT